LEKKYPGKGRGEGGPYHSVSSPPGGVGTIKSLSGGGPQGATHKKGTKPRDSYRWGRALPDSAFHTSPAPTGAGNSGGAQEATPPGKRGGGGPASGATTFTGGGNRGGKGFLFLTRPGPKGGGKRTKNRGVGRGLKAVREKKKRGWSDGERDPPMGHIFGASGVGTRGGAATYLTQNPGFKKKTPAVWQNPHKTPDIFHRPGPGFVVVLRCFRAIPATLGVATRLVFKGPTPPQGGKNKAGFGMVPHPPPGPTPKQRGPLNPPARFTRGPRGAGRLLGTRKKTFGKGAPGVKTSSRAGPNPGAGAPGPPWVFFKNPQRGPVTGGTEKPGGGNEGGPDRGKPAGTKRDLGVFTSLFVALGNFLLSATQGKNQGGKIRFGGASPPQRATTRGPRGDQGFRDPGFRGPALTLRANKQPKKTRT